jgi:D-alanyl-D-alanine carboxypeptidase
MDAETGKILQETNADTRNYPASLTKMMTLYLVFDALKSERLKLTDHIKVSAKATRQPSSKIGLKRKSNITVKQAILALTIKSANDVAVAVAETLAKNEHDFALKMTATARRIGMRSTTFRNASGLPHRAQLSTARDMAILGKALLRDFPHYYHFFSQSQFSFDGKVFKNHNRMLKNFDGADGIKTGYIRASGFNLVTSVKRGNRRLIGVVFGGRTPRARDRVMTRLLDNGFEQFGPEQIADGEAVGTTVADPAEKNAQPSGRWGIQVGAYWDVESAANIAKVAYGKVPELLLDGVVKVVPLRRKSGKFIYCGRILGLDRRQAYGSCRVLKRSKISCMVLLTKDSGAQVAASQK